DCLCVDGIDRLRADSLTIGREGHPPLSSVLLIAKFGPMSRKVFIGKTTECWNEPFRALPGFLLGERVKACVQELAGFCRLLSRLCERNLALGRAAKSYFRPLTIKPVVKDPSLAAVVRNGKVEIASVRVTTRFG